MSKRPNRTKCRKITSKAHRRKAILAARLAKEEIKQSEYWAQLKMPLLHWFDLYGPSVEGVASVRELTRRSPGIMANFTKQFNKLLSRGRVKR